MGKLPLKLKKQCVVAYCYNNPDEHISFHSFPKSKELWTKWKKFTNMRFAGEPPSIKRMCSAHFTSDCFISELNTTDSSLPIQRKLCKTGKFTIQKLQDNLDILFSIYIYIYSPVMSHFAEI